MFSVDDFINGGTAILGTGITSLFLALVGLIAFIFVSYKNKSLMWVVGILATSSAIFITGVVLYAQKVHVGYSYLLFVASSFILLVACFLLVIGTLQVKEERSEPLYEPPEPTSTPDYYEPPTNE